LERPLVCSSLLLLGRLAMAGLELQTLAVTAGDDGVYRVELNRPESRNAMNWCFWNELGQVFNALATDGACRTVVLSARGKSFSAGLDLTDSQNQPPPAEDVGRRGLHIINHVTVMQDAITAVENCLKPTIVVVHGACVGAGVDLITACDVRVCTSDTFFCIKEVAVGLAADVGTLARLPKVVGNDSVVRELALTARNFDANEAKSLGLISRVLPSQEDAIQDAVKVASQIAAHSPVAVVGTKKNLNYARDHTVLESLDYVRTWNACMLQSEDMGKAMRAAMQKSKPAFSKL